MEKDLIKIIDSIPEPLQESNKLPAPSIGTLRACELFYKLVYLDQIVKPMDDERQQLTKLKMEYDRRLAIALRDYTVLSIAGELRHVIKESTPISNKIKIYYVKDFPSESRNKTMDTAISYIPKTIIQAAILLFDSKQYSWYSGFGGGQWYKISTTADLYGSISNERFIDNTWNLRHNGDLFFNKNIIFKIGSYDTALLTFLEQRSRIKSDNLWTKSGLSFSKVMRTHKQHLKEVLDYVPVKWGDKVVILTDSKSTGNKIISTATYVSPLMKHIKNNKISVKKSN